ncbi:MAG: hypothetical protein WBM16_14965 [Pseudolabrys sp.]
MSYVDTITETRTFTETHARHMAAKVATDLKRIQRLYGMPSDVAIANYEQEVILLLKSGYLDEITYGYRRDGKWVEPTVRYKAKDLAGGTANDDDPGRIRHGANIVGASFYSYLSYSSAWFRASGAERNVFIQRSPIGRSDGPEPAVGGYLSADKTYSAGGRALDRSSVRNF